MTIYASRLGGWNATDLYLTGEVIKEYKDGGRLIKFAGWEKPVRFTRYNKEHGTGGYHYGQPHWDFYATADEWSKRREASRGLRQCAHVRRHMRGLLESFHVHEGDDDLGRVCERWKALCTKAEEIFAAAGERP